MKYARPLGIALVPALIFALSLGSCGGDDTNDDGGDGDGDARPDDGKTGSVCEVADECFPDVAEGDLSGDPVCLDRVDEGYCTHECETDADCCAAEGECEEGVSQVCGPFESTNLMMCFLACEAENVDTDPDSVDANDFCQRNVSTDFICRSTGGGSENRKVCVPGDCGLGKDCADNEDCGGELICNRDFEGGYCTVPDCEADADCPDDSVCVDGGAGTLCMKTCASNVDCSACRADGVFGTCTDDADLVESAGVSVCVPDAR
jgi:hypothetical protein